MGGRRKRSPKCELGIASTERVEGVISSADVSI